MINTTKRDDFFWYCQMDKATTLAAIETGILTKEQGISVAKAVYEVIQRGDAMDSADRPVDYLGVQAMLREAGGPETSRMHSGRSRQGLLATLHRCFIRDRFFQVFGQLLTVRKKMLELGNNTSDTLVPAYTNGVQAQPVTLGHLLCGYEFALQRTGRRMIESYERLNRSPLGCAALATTRFPVDRERLAALLGFDGCVENAFDAAQLAIVDVGAEAAQHASLAALSLSTFIQDIHAQFHHPRPWILLDNSNLLSPSTLMPQKRNPVVLNRARLAASKVLGASFTASLVGHNVNSGMTDYKRFDAAQTLEETRILLYEVTDILDGMRVDEAAAAAELASEFSTTSELAGYLQEKYDIAYAIGHTFASKLVDYGRRNQIRLPEMPEETIQEMFASSASENGLENCDCPLDHASFLHAIDPRRMVENYRGLGGSNPKEVRRLLEHSVAEHAIHTAWVDETLARFKEAEKRTSTRFKDLIKE